MEIDLDEVRAVRVLGRGAMGTVFLVADRSASPASLYALKVFEKHSPNAKPDADRRARWEVSVLSRLSHPYLPCLIGSAETSELLTWAVPFCPGGDLNALRYSLSDGIFSSAAIRFYLTEIISALAHLHSLGIVYRDLKPENVLIKADGHVTLTDFDLSRNLPKKQIHSQTSSPRAIPVESASKQHRRNFTRIFFGNSPSEYFGEQLKKAKSARVSPVSKKRPSFTSHCSVGTMYERSFSFVGTEEYVSPEVVRGDGHEFAVDWWALGILTYEMAYGKTPFKGRNRKETFRNVLTRQPEFIGRRRSELTDLIGKLLSKDPSKRLGFSGGAEEVRAHPFFNGVKWDSLDEVMRPPFLPPIEDLEEETTALDSAAAGEGFDIREYFRQLREPPPQSDQSTLALTEF
jgi:protein-serine/threonine kinase